MPPIILPIYHTTIVDGSQLSRTSGITLTQGWRRVVDTNYVGVDAHCLFAIR